MTYFSENLYNLFIFFSLCLTIAILLLFISYRVSPFKPDFEKLSAYECGFDPYEDARNYFDVRFYLIALLFLIFDLETIFFLPWSVSISFLKASSWEGMFDFIYELGIGFYYAYYIGALDWE
ncbi:MAG: NADH-quinone oxidoreductase subunit A [Rickettsiales bacterium]|nr:NADH-quinone oxidoreductase subunit A [Rickettsiales bacterium]